MIKLFSIGREIGLFKKTNATLHYRVPTTQSASVKKYFHYNIDVFNLSQLSRANLQINILQTASLMVSNLPHSPPQNKGFKQKFGYVTAREGEKKKNTTQNFSHKEK